MSRVTLPKLTDADLTDGLQRAAASPRRRHPKILHHPGAEFNEVINFMMNDTYMQPHLHPGEEKIEKIYVLRGSLAVLYFDDHGKVMTVTLLGPGGADHIEVPAFTWHTYVMLTDSAVTYETMMGKYEPSTWKKFSGQWGPAEDSAEAPAYLAQLKAEATKPTASRPTR
jgi:cupin fold WbuC family metalloprotein